MLKSTIMPMAAAIALSLFAKPAVSQSLFAQPQGQGGSSVILATKNDGAAREDASQRNQAKPKKTAPVQAAGDPQETYEIFSVAWKNEIDADGDGYTFSRQLEFDVDVSSGTYTIYAQIYVKAATTSSYTLLGATPNFQITGNSPNDKQLVGIYGGAPQLNDYRIRVYRAGSSVVQAEADLDDFGELEAERFESAANDLITHYNYKIYDAWWDDESDSDNDGYDGYRKLYFDVDVASGTRSVYAKIYRKTSTSSNYSLYFTTPNFLITDNSTADRVWIAVGPPNTSLSKNDYDFRIWVIEAGTDFLVANLSQWDNGDLDDQSFESEGTAVSESPATRIESFQLEQNHPNPFNPETTIRYSLPSRAQVQLVIYDLAGRVVKYLVSEQQAPGEHSAQWNGRDDAGNSVASGVYAYRLTATPSFGAAVTLTRKLTFMK